MKTLYDNISSENKTLRFFTKFEAFSKKYGWLIIIFLFIIRRFFNTGETKTGEHFDFIQQVLGVLSPLMVLVPVLFLTAMKKERVKGFYLEKYIEDYRKESGLTEEEWYGLK